MDIVKKCITSQTVGFAIKKAIYIGVRIAFYLDMDSKSKKKFDEEFSS